jgi:hypothetical protein
MAEDWRQELAASFRLIATSERWFCRDLLVGAVLLALWTVLSGAAIAWGIPSAGFLLDSIAGEPTAPVLAAVVLSWLLIPAVATVRRLHTRMLNLRNNVQQYYRATHPATLLAPPGLCLIVALGLVSILHSRMQLAPILLVPVSLYVLARTMAYSYRVYAFSHPGLVRFGGVISTAILLAGLFLTVATATGRGDVTTTVLATTGLPKSVFSPVRLGWLTVPATARLALAPAAFASTYVGLQWAISVGFRVFKPTVDRSKMRTGQRYPPFLEVSRAVDQQPQAPDARADPSAGAADAGAGPHAHEGTEPTADTAPTQSATGSATDTNSAADQRGTIEDGDSETDDALDDVSHTRVFTPPEDGEFPEPASGDVEGSNNGSDADSDESESIDSAGTETRATQVGGQTDGGPGDANVGEPETDTDSHHCPTCGEFFTTDTTVKFCPHCGSAIDMS